MGLKVVHNTFFLYENGAFVLSFDIKIVILRQIYKKKTLFMVQNIFKGLGIALVTPFTSDGSVDYQSLSRLVEYQLKNGADFFCILATTGETPTLTAEEKKNNH